MRTHIVAERIIFSDFYSKGHETECKVSKKNVIDQINCDFFIAFHCSFTKNHTVNVNLLKFVKVKGADLTPSELVDQTPTESNVFLIFSAK